MSFRPEKQQPQFADLNGILAQSKIPDNSLYQVVQILIERLTQLQAVINEILAGKLGDNDAFKKFATKFATYHTKEDETSVLPNSIRLLAGLGITFDDTVPNVRTINGTSNVIWMPLTDGDRVSADLITALGECIMVAVPFE